VNEDVDDSTFDVKPRGVTGRRNKFQTGEMSHKKCGSDYTNLKCAKCLQSNLYLLLRRELLSQGWASGLK
jgi:hypothetical protein